jgi:hypothetical protein
MLSNKTSKANNIILLSSLLTNAHGPLTSSFLYRMLKQHASNNSNNHTHFYEVCTMQHRAQSYSGMK